MKYLFDNRSWNCLASQACKLMKHDVKLSTEGYEVADITIQENDMFFIAVMLKLVELRLSENQQLTIV